MEVFSFISVFVFALIGIVPFVAIAVLVFLLVKKNQHPADGKSGTSNPSANLFSLKNLIKVYLYIIVSVSSLVLIVGASYLGKVLFSVFDTNFSYGYEYLADKNYVQPLNDNGTSSPMISKESMVPVDSGTMSCYSEDVELRITNGKGYCVKSSEMKMDLINGITITISMLIIFAIHLFILLRMEGSEPSRNMRKFFMFMNLIFYSGSSLILIPVSIYQTMNYLILADKPVSSYNAPGMLVAYAIFSFITWMIWLSIVLSNKEHEGELKK